jgi:hypothetical protein
MNKGKQERKAGKESRKGKQKLKAVIGMSK